MARIVAVRDADDLRLTDYLHLTDVKLRKNLESAHGLFVAEGEKVIRRALTAGYPPRSLLITERRLAGVADLLDACEAPAYIVPDPVAERVTGFHVHRGVLASMARVPARGVSEVLAGTPGTSGTADPGGALDQCGVGDPAGHGLGPAGDRPARHNGPAQRIIVLEDIVDHGNVGGIFRCAAGLGIDAVILSPRCADPLYRRAVRVSMGAVLAIPYARMTDWYHGLAELRGAGFRLLALTPDQSALPIGSVPAAGRAALMLGTEGDGLSSRWRHEADDAVCIPMASGAMTAGVDSLNVVAAAAIACHCFATDLARDDDHRPRARL